ncbi:MAG: FAD:protein FMN transferase [Kiritimatiellaeota bacterium]|nr:FAD:protein FMN transferase [Kiritimatiellota bacterium]
MHIAQWLCAVLALCLCGGCREQGRMGDRGWTAMGTTVHVKAPEAQLAEAVEIAREAIEEVEAELSPFRKDSVVGRLNAGEEAGVSPHVATVLALADKAWRESDGTFDPTVGPLMTLWGFRGTPRETIPTKAEIAVTLADVGWDKIVETDNYPSLPQSFILPSGMKLDFGAIAKGYAVDAAYKRLQEAGILNVLVNAGGEIRGNREGKPWRIAVRDPCIDGGRLGVLALTDGRATATSGRYERFVEIDGKRYAHIIDPRTGWPVTGWEQVTVVADSAAEADALSTSLFILGPEKGMMMLQAYPGAEALFVSDDGKTLIATRGFGREFTAEKKHEGHIVYRD